MNKRIITLLLGLLFSQQVFSTKTISIKDFGAKGNGKTNDHEAFEKAAEYINKQKQDVTLMIPFGTYIIGKQTSSSEWLLNGNDVMYLKECKNIKILGEKLNGKYTKLKFADSLYFGSFYADGPKKYSPKCTPVKNYFNRKTCAFIASCFNIDQCSNVTISNFEVDGNLQGMIIGGPYGDVGRQLNHRGFFLHMSLNVTLENIFVHHLALDGVENSGSTNTQLTNVSSTYNGRQGLSWTNGDGLTATNCKFNNTGNSRIGSSPGAGMDIEPEGGKSINNGTFINCEFMNNIGCGIVNDRNTQLVNNILFKNCTIVGYYNWALWVMGTHVRFEDCNIYGHCTHTIGNNDVKTADDITLFKHCTFSNVYKNRYCKKLSGYLMDFNDAKINMVDCKIEAYNVGFLWHSNNDQRKGLESKISGTTINSNNETNVHAMAGGLLMDHCTLNLTEKIPFTILGIANGNNSVQLVSKAALDKQMKSEGILPYADLETTYACGDN